MSLKVIDPNKFISNPGERFKVEYVGEMDETGMITLVEVGKTDLVELHQRDAFANDVNVLYERFCNGDISVLSQRQGMMMDVCGMPRDLRGMYDLMQGFERQYENLPDAVKEKYTVEQFIEKAGSSQWLKDMHDLTDTTPNGMPIADESNSSTPPA